MLTTNQNEVVAITIEALKKRIAELPIKIAALKVELEIQQDKLKAIEEAYL